MNNLKFENSFINFTGEEEKPFEFIIGNDHYGSQDISQLDAKDIADFIYFNLGLKHEKKLSISELISIEKFTSEKIESHKKVGLNEQVDFFKTINDKCHEKIFLMLHELFG